MKNITSLTGWILLLLVLGVPALLFYNWWSSRKDELPQSTAYKPVHDPNLFKERQEGKVVSDTSMALSKQSAMPISVSTPTPTSVGGKSTVPEGVVHPFKTSVEKETTKSTAVFSSAIKNLPSDSTATLVSKQEFKTTPSSGTVSKLTSYYMPKTSRDPTLSPGDYAKIIEQEQERLEYERQQRLMELKRLRESNPIYKINLQGIVVGASGRSSAIINGEMVSEGGTIMGAKIIKIAIDYVIMEYKGKKYKKVLR
jgi:hypothetical protein